VTQEELESRRQKALDIAEECAELLKRRFGATRVLPFGSVLGEAPWHEASDLDLAVEGLSSEALWEAEKELEAIVPSWLEVNLVPLERAYPEVRARILRGRSMPENPYLALKARLEDELVGLERIARGLDQALERAGAEPDEFATRALASYVDDFYKGCERICERVAVTLDGGLPRGERWHQVLLGLMGEPGGGGRPPLFGGLLLLELDEYRRFRHRVRHIYGYELEAERVLALARGVKPVLARVRKALEVFGQWLESQATSVSNQKMQR
jgi:predicted nucleotidyltransferase